MKVELLTFCILVLAGQNLAAQGILDVPPRGQQNERAVTGGGQRVRVDTNTPLSELIGRLEDNWQEVQTGKAYWIGYTKDMYSIAAHGGGAIDPLLAFIRKTESAHAKRGGILVLHLIGIDRSIAGRFHEEFKNRQARVALLNLLPNRDLRDYAMRLLVRDPWPSDVPFLMSVMAKSKDDCWAIVNGLFRYELRDIPFRGTVPKHLAAKTVKFTQPDDFDSKEFLWHILKSMQKVAGKSLVLEHGLLKRNLWGYTRSGYGGGNAGVKEEFFGSLLSDIVESDHTSSYCNLGNRMQYYVQNGKVYICSSRAATQRWLAWWQKQSQDTKKDFTDDTQPKDEPYD